LKVYFQQHVDLDTGINTVALTGIKDGGYLHQIISSLPSTAGQDISCADSALRKDLMECTWNGLPPHVVPTPPPRLRIPPHFGYADWLSFNISHPANSTRNEAVISIVGKNTRACKLLFDTPVSDFLVEGAVPADASEKVPNEGTREIRLWSRTWEKPWHVRIRWGEGASSTVRSGLRKQRRQGLNGKMYCDQQSCTRNSSTVTQAPSIKLILRLLTHANHDLIHYLTNPPSHEFQLPDIIPQWLLTRTVVTNPNTDSVVRPPANASDRAIVSLLFHSTYHQTSQPLPSSLLRGNARFNPLPKYPTLTSHSNIAIVQQIRNLSFCCNLEGRMRCWIAYELAKPTPRYPVNTLQYLAKTYSWDEEILNELKAAQDDELQVEAMKPLWQFFREWEMVEKGSMAVRIWWKSQKSWAKIRAREEGKGDEMMLDDDENNAGGSALSDKDHAVGNTSLAGSSGQGSGDKDTEEEDGEDYVDGVRKLRIHGH
ncbi:MAG: hypothetical protein Q9218_008068, partial [Villophora microphyllina]